MSCFLVAAGTAEWDRRVGGPPILALQRPERCACRHQALAAAGAERQFALGQLLAKEPEGRKCIARLPSPADSGRVAVQPAWCLLAGDRECTRVSSLLSHG